MGQASISPSTLREPSPARAPEIQHRDLNEPLGPSATITTGWAWQQIPGLRWFGNPIGVSLYGGPGGGGPVSEATLAPYDDCLRWAPRGRAWLLVSAEPAPEFPDHWGYEADVPRSFSLTLPNGAHMGPRSGTAGYKPNANDNGPAKVSLMFEVSAALRTFRLSFTPVGTICPPDGISPVHVTDCEVHSRGQIVIKL